MSEIARSLQEVGVCYGKLNEHENSLEYNSKAVSGINER